MRKITLYIILAVIVFAVLALMMRGNYGRKRMPDQRITLRKSDKIPYGTFVAYRELKHLFPSAAISSEKSTPGFWGSLSSFEGNQAILVICRRFFATENEMKKLIDFARAGNHVFISAREYSISVQNMMDLRSSGAFPTYDLIDTLAIHLKKPPFTEPVSYHYPGKKFDAQLFKFDSSITTVLGTSDDDEANFVRLKAGSGYIYVHMAPLAFSNYFLLHKKNIGYYNRILSMIPGDINRLVWDEYFLTKLQEPEQRRRQRWLRVMMKQPAFKWGMLTALFAFIVFILLEMRRKQRQIPLLVKPRNESLDFVKTIGRLYYDKNDHLNLSRKMSSYFLEYVRNRYKLSTGMLNADFIKNLHYKSGYSEEEIKEIVSFINFTETAPGISDGQLSRFYRQLESFYKKT